MMAIPFEEQYQDVLQNIESAIVGSYRERPEDVSDWSVETALNALIRSYGAEQTGRSAPIRAALGCRAGNLPAGARDVRVAAGA
jgi:hypothetical protein